MEIDFPLDWFHSGSCVDLHKENDDTLCDPTVSIRCGLVSSKSDKACNKSCLPSISSPAAGSRQGKPPQAKCYSSLLVFEVTASWAAEAAACGLWLVGLLKIWSLTFQVRMSHRHWSHNCSCEITQARWEERTSEQTCGLDSVSDNTTECVCVCVFASVHVVFPQLPTDAMLQPLAETLSLPLPLSNTVLSYKNILCVFTSARLWHGRTF